MNLAKIGMVLVVGIEWASAQTQTAERAEFEVTSVKSNTGMRPGMFVHALSGGRLSMENYPLMALIGIAWNVKDFQIVGGPSWVKSDGYNIDAKSESNLTFEQMRPLLQTLLEDRFKLSLRRETREAAIYKMIAAKSGLKLAAKGGTCVSSDPGNPGPPPSGKMFCGGLRMGKGRMAGAEISTSLLAGALSDVLGRQVLDETGFNGPFDFSLEFAPDESIANANVAGRLGPATGSDSTSPSIFSALQEQLGIRLEATKAPVEMLVIDSVGRPSGN